MVDRVERERNIVNIIALIIGAMFITAVVLIVLQVILSQHMNQLSNVICVSIATICGFVVFPVLLLKKTYTLSLRSLGLCNLRLADWIVFAISVATITVAYYFSNKQVEWFLLLIAQNLIVAAAEEFLCRSSLIFLLHKTIRSKLLVGIISTAIFVFVVHSNATIIENLIWRLPVSIVIVCAYMKSKSIYIPFAIHFTYNVIVSIV